MVLKAREVSSRDRLKLLYASILDVAFALSKQIWSFDPKVSIEEPIVQRGGVFRCNAHLFHFPPISAEHKAEKLKCWSGIESNHGQSTGHE